MLQEPSSTFHSQITSLMEELAKHPVYDNQYFQFLRNTPWNRQTYDFHRANFFHRTEGTVKGIALVCARSAAHDDRESLMFFARILNEETGNGNPKHCHELLMENAHNLYANVEFDLPLLLVREARNSNLIIDETIEYRNRTLELLSASYPRMLGVAMALESHADPMLWTCREAFRNSRNKLPKNEFVDNVEVYFNNHISNGVEERHAADARTCVVKNCRSEADVAEIAYAARETLNVQLRLWEAMHRRSMDLTAGSGQSVVS